MAGSATTQAMTRSQVQPFQANSFPSRAPAVRAAQPANDFGAPDFWPPDFWPEVSGRLARENPVPVNPANAPGPVLREIGLILGAAALFVLTVIWFVPAP
jgi:hypothetical protein